MGWSFKQKGLEEIPPFWFCLDKGFREFQRGTLLFIIQTTEKKHINVILPKKRGKNQVKIQTYQCQLWPSNHLEPPWPGTMTNGNTVDGLRMKSTNRHRWATWTVSAKPRVSGFRTQQLELPESKMNFWPGPVKISEEYLEVRLNQKQLIILGIQTIEGFEAKISMLSWYFLLAHHTTLEV